MTRPTDGAAAIQVSIDKIKEIANTTVAGAETDGNHSLSGFKSSRAPESSFGEVPLAQQLAQQQQAAHDIFVETVQGVVQDLQDFRDQLIASANAHQHTDDAAYAALVALGREYQGHHYHSRQNYRRSLAEHGGGPPAEPRTSPAGATTGAAPTSPPPDSGQPPTGDGTPAGSSDGHAY